MRLPIECTTSPASAPRAIAHAIMAGRLLGYTLRGHYEDKTPIFAVDCHYSWLRRRNSDLRRFIRIINRREAALPRAQARAFRHAVNVFEFGDVIAAALNF